MRLDEREEECADAIMQGMEIKDEDVPKIRGTVHSFVSDYARKTSDVSDKDFLVKKFSNYPSIWENGQEMEKTATDIVEMVYEYERNHKELNEHIRSGKRRESWLAKKIEEGAKASGAVNVASYASKIDQALDRANEDMMRTIQNMDGSISGNMNLDGLIAEQHYASTFNIDAAVKEKSFTAKPLESNTKNSIDIVIKNARMNTVRRYQSKYGKEAETTEGYFEKGDYRGQRKLVPEG